MARIYTSYFANWRKYEGKFTVSIARFDPKYAKVDFVARKVNDCIAPNATMLSAIKAGSITKEQYKEQYLHQLQSGVRGADFIRYICKLADGKDIVLLCYEKPSDFCHRHILADWLNNIIREQKLDILPIVELGHEAVQLELPFEYD